MTSYDVFISHSSKDKEKATQLGRDLQQEGYSVWFDTAEIEPSEDWIREIEQGVDNASMMVVIWTENAASSKWVEREIARADDKEKPIIPLCFDDTEISSILLQRIQYIDFQNSYFRPFQQLVSRLMSLIDDSGEQPTDSASGPWQSTKRPYYRSRFLEVNNYLDRKDRNFAINEWTQKLGSVDI